MTRTDALPAARSRLRALAGDRRGVAAIEFAMVVPVLIALYLGSVDLCLGITLHRKVQHAGSLMNDLATRVNNLTRAELDGILDMGDATVKPRAASLSTAKISAIYVDNDGKANIVWSRARKVAADTVGQSVTLPADLQGLRDANLVRTEATYAYQPFGMFGFGSPFVMKQDVFAAARINQSVVCSDC